MAKQVFPTEKHAKTQFSFSSGNVWEQCSREERTSGVQMLAGEVTLSADARKGRQRRLSLKFCGPAGTAPFTYAKPLCDDRRFNYISLKIIFPKLYL